MFFPQLVAGPIVRASEIVNQLRFKTKFEYSFLVSGIERILVGLFLKTVLADNIAPLVDDGFYEPKTAKCNRCMDIIFFIWLSDLF